MAIALPDLIALSILLVAYGLISAGTGLVKLLNWFIQSTVGQVPLIGSIVAAPVDRGLQAISSFLGSVASGVENYMGIVWHNAASMVEWLGREIAAGALVDVALAEKIAGLAVHATAQAVTNVVVHTEHEIVTHTITDVRTVERVADQATQAAVGALTGRLGTVEGELRDVLEPSVEGLRARAGEIEAGFQRAWDLLRQHEEALGVGAVTAATAIALEQLGGSWIRCAGTGAVGKALCGLGPEVLEALLAGLIDLGVLYDLCALTDLLNAAAESAPVQDAIALIVGGIDDLIACQDAHTSTGLKQTYYATPGPLTAIAAPGALV